MSEPDGYLSKDRAYLAKLQRQRRASMVRIDYMPGKDALAAIDANRATLRPGSVAATNSAVLDAIVTEWAELTGINCREVKSPMTSANSAGISRAFRALAHDFGDGLPTWAASWLAAGRAKQASRRVICGARRHRDGQPCRAKSEPGKRRCKWHGGCSTGPRTVEGKAKALANLRQYSPSKMEQAQGRVPATEAKTLYCSTKPHTPKKQGESAGAPEIESAPLPACGRVTTTRAKVELRARPLKWRRRDQRVN